MSSEPKPRWRKPAVCVGIAAYLGTLLTGLAMHQFNHPAGASIPGYLIVWDMFCGWSGYERRVDYIAEGESGRFYDASEVPGRGITPHGPHARRNFDFRGEYSNTLIRGVLARTEHEPIRRVYVVESHTPKLHLSAGGVPPVHRHVQAIVSNSADSVTMPTWFSTQITAALTPPDGLKTVTGLVPVSHAEAAPALPFLR